MLIIRHYDLDVTLKFQPDFLPHSAPGSLFVQARLTVENPDTETASTLPLLFYRLHMVSDVSVEGTPVAVTSRLTGLEGQERHQVNLVSIDLPKPLAPGAACTVGLNYGGVTAGAREVWPYIWDSVTRDYSLLRPDVIWYPLPALPTVASYHQTFRTHKHFDVRVQVPEGYTAVAPALVSLQAGIAHFRTTAPRDRFDLAIAPFARLHSNGVSVYHLPGDAQWGTDALGWVAATQRGLTERLGPRNTADLAIVQIPYGWGSQNTPQLILQQAGPPGDWRAAREVVHEVSHFWTPRPTDYPRRFEEPLACFFQSVLAGDLYGPEMTAKELAGFQADVDGTPGAADARFLDAEIPPDLHNTLWYAKGALALNALRTQLGDQQFWPFLREYTGTPTATTQGFVDLLRQRHPGPETEAYVHHWFG